MEAWSVDGGFEQTENYLVMRSKYERILVSYPCVATGTNYKKKNIKKISMKIIIIQKLRDMLIENLYDFVFLINLNRDTLIII